MKKYKLILVVFLVFSLPLFSENESGKVDYLKEVTGEYYDIFGNVDGGVRVILNSKSGFGRITLAVEKYIRNHEEEYHLKPESEISIEVFSNKFSVEYSLFFSKSKKIFLEFSDNEEVYLSLNYNKYFILYCIGVLSVFLLLASLMLSSIIYPNLNTIKFFIFPIYIIIFGYWYLFKNTSLMELIIA